MPSIIDPIYRNGIFHSQSSGAQDSAYKVNQFRLILEKNKDFLPNGNLLVADIGCGAGKTTVLVRNMLSDCYGSNIEVHGYDVHSDVQNNEVIPGVKFFYGDFSETANCIYDLALLFDVIEHVPDPIGFIKLISERCKRVGLHIPLDNSLLGWTRNLPRINLIHPGHILVMDTADAINILSFSGLRVIDYTYSPIFNAPSGKETRNQRFMRPARRLLFWFSPYLTQKLLGGVSLMVIARSPLDFE